MNKQLTAFISNFNIYYCRENSRSNSTQFFISASCCTKFLNCLITLMIFYVIGLDYFYIIFFFSASLQRTGLSQERCWILVWVCTGLLNSYSKGGKGSQALLLVKSEGCDSGKLILSLLTSGFMKSLKPNFWQVSEQPKFLIFGVPKLRNKRWFAEVPRTAAENDKLWTYQEIQKAKHTKKSASKCWEAMHAKLGESWWLCFGLLLFWLFLSDHCTVSTEKDTEVNSLLIAKHFVSQVTALEILTAWVK